MQVRADGGLEIKSVPDGQQMHMTVSIYYTSYDWSNGKERVSLGCLSALCSSPAYSALWAHQKTPGVRPRLQRTLQVLMDGPKAVWLQNMLSLLLQGSLLIWVFDPVCTSSESHSDFNFHVLWQPGWTRAHPAESTLLVHPRRCCRCLGRHTTVPWCHCWEMVFWVV